ncbi:uncharacterized protein LOC108906218 [Anoplophora glabripennis]|uniref:uncharacterized protein LOC108906218 n=1 Tax=Anoplophora glabripennis TaxID=217634 RepID=UPI00087524EB|nr:uncharacterized protein LOC108906218 [Anoplophora glabripennis]
MDNDKTEFVDKTVLNTPKPTACSTVDKKSFQKRIVPVNMDFENSLGIINVDSLQNISEDQIHSISSSDLSYLLKQQRLLANSSLQRANKVAGLPSKYLRPNISSSSISNVTVNDSTISESDLMKSPQKTPKNTSTPRASVASSNSAENSLSRLSLGQSIAQLSYQIGNTDISLDSFVKEFQKTMNSVNKVPQIDSQLFSPAEEAASMLLADEMSWRRQNEMPLVNNFSQVSNEDISDGKVSVGAFFQQRSDTLSDFKMALSPVKSKNPIPLIDSSISFTEEDNEKNRKSLSISAINKLLIETDDTPRKVTSYLFKQGQKLSENLIDQPSLPVSKNSSYTSNYSDNEVMRQIVADKENIDTYNIPQDVLEDIKEDIGCSSQSNNRPLSAGSTRSLSSALTNLPHGKLPIESTKMELIWGCVKVDKCVTQEFLLRNKAPKRLCLQMSITGYDFKIRKENRQDSDPLSSAKILLHPYESRAIIVSFIPTKIGAAVDQLSFTSVDPNLQQTKKQSVMLFGYGGFGKVNILNLTKDMTGKFWLSLGKLDNRNVISHNFVIKNSGTLPCFAYIVFNPKDLFGFANVTVTPSFSTLIPNEQKEITVTFVLTMEDHQVLQRSMFSNAMVAEIGNLLIISGTEVNRGRLRRQCRKSAEKGLEIDALSNILKEKIQGEVMPADINLFKEAPGNLKDILRLFTRNEVVMTIEQDPEVTIMPQYPDETGMFHTLCQDSTLMCLETTTAQASCKLEPASIILTPPTKIRDSLFLTSDCKKRIHFEVVSNPEGLDICPKEGIIAPGEEIIINVACSKLTIKEKKVFKVLVYVENEVFEATVKIAFIHSKIKGT